MIRSVFEGCGSVVFARSAWDINHPSFPTPKRPPRPHPYPALLHHQSTPQPSTPQRSIDAGNTRNFQANETLDGQGLFLNGGDGTVAQYGACHTEYHACHRISRLPHRFPTPATRTVRKMTVVKPLTVRIQRLPHRIPLWPRRMQRPATQNTTFATQNTFPATQNGTAQEGQETQNTMVATKYAMLPATLVSWWVFKGGSAKKMHQREPRPITVAFKLTKSPPKGCRIWLVVRPRRPQVAQDVPICTPDIEKTK